MPNLNMFFNLPMPVKAGLLLASGGGIIMLLFMLMQSNVLPPAVGYLVLVVLALAAAAGGAWKFVSKKMEKRKGKPFEQKLAESSAAAPQGVSDPGSRAKLDDLRKRFDEGIQVFKDHGKDLYTMPWYVIVGEPGSGKTEAMRHSNVGFPPGLQNQLQGVGGTVNMHWWFTNEAVMIDTAGRLMFEEVEPGQTSEWNEFLKMLRTARPNCPLNGMLLVIPADSLIKDTANDIDRKGSKIAQQLDQIQRALGVRFPVYILISKADRINGFREFFDELTDPVAAMQMMGWSSPNDLDTAFDPSMVEQHLKTVRDRLVRRRFALLSNPVHSDDPMGRRIDQVDALYAFPDSLVKLAPRLRRYLEMVFVAGEWSQKPLFLRGIYFTSSMREGDALDADLADVLGVQVDALVEGKLWERERSYFLKDVFKEKMFRERGLVTRETNVGKSRRRQSMILMGAAAAAALVIGGWTWFSVRKLNESVAGYSQFWTELAKDIRSKDLGAGIPDQNARSVMAVTPVDPWEYRDGMANWGLEFKWTLDGKAMGAGSEHDRRIDMQETAWEHASRIRTSSTTPLIFRFAGALTTDLPERLPEAQRALFESKVLDAFVNTARGRMKSRLAPKEWNRPALEALASLVEMQAIGLPGGPGSGESAPAYQRWIESLGFRGAEREAPFQGPGLTERGWGKLVEPSEGGTHAQRLAKVFDQTYRSSDGAVDLKALAAALDIESADAMMAVKEGIGSFVEAGGLREGSGGLLTQLQAFNAAAAEYVRAEETLGAFGEFASVQTKQEFEGARERWLAGVADLEAKKKIVDSVLYTGDGTTLTEIGRFLTETAAENLRDEMSKRASRDINDSFGLLLDAIPVIENPGEYRPEGSRARVVALSEHRDVLERARKALEDEVAGQVEVAFGATPSRYRTSMMARSAGSQEPAYVARFRAITAVAALVGEEPDFDQVNIFTLAQAVGALGERIKATPAPSEVASCAAASAAYQRYGETLAVEATLSKLLEAGTIGQLVAFQQDGATRSLGLAALPLLGVSAENDRVDPQFDPQVAQSLFESQNALDGRFGSEASDLLDAASLTQTYARVKDKLGEYRGLYATYWMQTVPMRFTVPSGSVPDVWGSWKERILPTAPDTACDRLLESTRTVLEAIEAIPTAQGEMPELATYREALATDVRNLAADASLRTNARRVWNSWRGLDNAAAGALSALRQRMQPDNLADFHRDYLATTEPTTGAWTPARRYWHSFVQAGLTSLSSAYTVQSDRDMADLKSSGKAIPLVRGRGVTRVLTREQLIDLGNVADRLLGVADRQEDAPRGERAPDVSREIQEELDKLSGRRSGFNEEQRTWLRTVSRVARALTSGPVPPQVAIVFPRVDGVPTPHPSKAFWDDDGTYARVERGGAPFGSGGYMINIGEGVKPIAERRLPDGGEPIVVKFYATENAFRAGNPPFVQGEIPSEWNGLQLWLQTDYTRGPEPRQIDGYTLVELARDRQGHPFYLGVRLPDNLPTWEEWPSLDTWPE
ncbi:MAG: hypothetical protein DYG94_10610 [Leptolyngbya sp. PLA3]|nr:MAG: hypothetical protein EDM82_09175 [Cyanobacteria bacterium CYA]MCE7969183.1 hypothetical protein [Leptolyngbya sp. PL-A3]